MSHDVTTRSGQAPVPHHPKRHPEPQAQRGRTAAQPAYRGPARTAHGGAYWLWLGWWWEPTKWSGRVMLWLLFWPLGLWRSIRHHQRNQQARVRRGYRR